ncbi:MAG: hypothetical protein AMXMBFR84_15740 [Candidatus Hydrogenedentota bacterium]
MGSVSEQGTAADRGCATNGKWARGQAVQILSFIIVFAAGFGLRAYNLDKESLWFDEAVSVSALDSATLSEFFAAERTYDPAMMPLYLLFEYFIAKWGGDSILLLRWFSVLTAAGSMGVLYAFGRSLGGHFCGLTALIMLSFSKHHIWHSQDIRMYSLYYFLAIMSSYVFFLALYRNKTWLWPVWIAANAAMLATHFFGCTLMLVQGIVLLSRLGIRHRLLYLLALGHLPVLLPFAWWVKGFSTSKMDIMLSWIPLPTWQVLLESYLYVHSGALLFGNEETPHLKYNGGMIVGSVFALLLLHLMLMYAMRPKCKPWSTIRGKGVPSAGSNPDQGITVPAVGFLVLWFVLPTLVLYALSHAVRPCYVERYVLHSSYALFLLGAVSIVSFDRSLPRLGAIIAILISSAYVLSDLRRPIRPDWKSVTDFIQSKYVQGDLVRIPEWYGGEFTLASQHYHPNLPIEGVGIGFAEQAMVMASLGVTVWVPVIQQPPLDPERLKVELAGRNIPFDVQVFDGRKPITLFRINEERSYILENLSVITERGLVPLKPPPYRGKPTSK